MRVKSIEEFTEMFRSIMRLEEYIDLEKLIIDLKGEIVNHDETFTRISRINNGNEVSFSIALPITNDTSERRYLLAHSIGHLLIHMNYLLDDEKWQTTEDYFDSAYYRQGHNIENYEAHVFAMELLLDKRSFFRIAKENLIDGVYRTDKISEHFEVPTQYVIERGRKLGLFSFDLN